MKYIFFGTPRFAAIILEKLIKAGLAPVALVCNPDEPVGRKKILTAPPTKIIAQANNIPVFQPKKLSEIKNELKNINADIFIVAAYNKIISEEIINIPEFKTIGVHPSLLPKYRGPSPIQTAILNGDKETGVDLFLIDKEIDHGPVLASSECEISEKDNYETMEVKLAELGAKLLIENFSKYLSGKLKAKEQDHSQATLTKKFSTEDGRVNLPDYLLCHSALDAESSLNSLNSRRSLPSSHIGGENDNAEENSAKLIFNKIRALNPDPGVFTFIKIPTRSRVPTTSRILDFIGRSSIPEGIGTKTGEKRLKLLEAEIRDGKLELLKVQPEGKKPMSYKDFLNGLKNN
ncbi:MAG: methionyl-tRNA formyltransferase [bacterium]|nr:methionyl-tRNA formyltransferase [bacterium]